MLYGSSIAGASMNETAQYTSNMYPKLDRDYHKELLSSYPKEYNLRRYQI